MDNRPNPDALLEKVQRDEAQARRGQLKIFFGSCAGVGKTCAMLQAARQQQQKGVDVVVGLLETHGRVETAQLLTGLDLLPTQAVNYQGRLLAEFDLDAALARKPALILVDELAHSNLPSCRHPKRWQDIDELLAAGINVYSTVNVQHLESLNDIVGQITGIRVRETIPDKVFDGADDIVLVDLPPDELIQRLKEGKVYLPEQATRASRNFFRKGNLIALRELALRRTADRVDAQMRYYRQDQAIYNAWQAKERLLVGINCHANSENMVRAAARLAASLRADWLVAYVETPAEQSLTTQQQDQLLKTQKLAQELGAETVSLSGENRAETLLAYAQTRNVSKLVLGKSHVHGWQRLWKQALATEIHQRANNEIDLYLIGKNTPETKTNLRQQSQQTSPTSATTSLANYGWAAAICGVVTLATAGLIQVFDLANIIMLYLLAVVLITIRLGKGAGIFASFFSVAAFDFFFVAPRWSFSVSDTQYVFTFAVMLVVALIISNLTARLRYQADIATYREQRTASLYAIAKELASSLTTESIIDISHEHLDPLFQAKSYLLLPDLTDKIVCPATATTTIANLDSGIAQWVYDQQQAAGIGTNTLPASPLLYLPLKAPMRTRGILVLQPSQAQLLRQPEQQQLLDTFASQIALALERVHFVDVARDALVNMEGERLRNSLLSTISHDLRTPLTSLIAMASLLEKNLHQPKEALEITHYMQQQALRMNQLITNLLDMARLQTGGVTLNRQWQAIEETIGSSIYACQQSLTAHIIRTDVPPDLPLVFFDAVLIERVLCNLLENACKYTPAQSIITVSARVHEQHLIVTVSDNGSGLAVGMEKQIFTKFTRGDKESTQTGVGLGLAICQAIIDAHHGSIKATNIDTGGACFTFTLPASEPPPLTAEEPEDP